MMKAQYINVIKPIVILTAVLILTAACTQAENGANAKSPAGQPNTDIQAAVITGDLEAVKAHIAAGTDLNQKEQMTGSTPLISAATFGKTDIAEALISAGADISIQNNDGSTALHSAAFFCRVEIVQLLIDADADKSVRNNFGATARESVMGPFAEVKPIYEMMAVQLEPFGLQLDMAELEKTRPVIAMMLQ